MLCLNEWWLYELLFEFMGGCVTKVGEWVGRQAESSRGSWEWWILKTNSGLSWTINLPFGIDFGINLDKSWSFMVANGRSHWKMYRNGPDSRVGFRVLLEQSNQSMLECRNLAQWPKRTSKSNRNAILIPFLDNKKTKK